MRRFVFSEGTSNKFWEISVDGTAVTTRYGRIGADGQVTVKKEANREKAQALADKLVREKIGKGYVEQGAKAAKAPAAKPAKPTKHARSAKPAKPATSARTDRARLAVAFSTLRKQGFVALEETGGARTDGWTEVYEQAGDETTPAVFWTEENAVDRFVGDRLAGTLELQWRGDGKAIAAALKAAGLQATAPRSKDSTISVRGAPGQGPVKKDASKPAAPVRKVPRDSFELEDLEPATRAIVAAFERTLDEMNKKKKWSVWWHPKLTARDFEDSPIPVVVVRVHGSLFESRMRASKGESIDLAIFGKAKPKDIVATLAARNVPARQRGSSNVIAVSFRRA